MDILDLLLHLLGFAAPAAALALLLAFCAWGVGLGKTKVMSMWTLVSVNFIIGLVVLGGGLWYFGRDGKMATYAALVVVMATVQWFGSAAWRRG